MDYIEIRHRTIIILIFLTVFFCSCSQKQFYRVEVLVKEQTEESFTNANIPFVNVLLSSKGIKYNRETGYGNGIAVFDSVKRGDYILSAKFVGYSQVEQKVSINRDKKIKIFMSVIKIKHPDVQVDWHNAKM